MDSSSSQRRISTFLGHLSAGASASASSDGNEYVKVFDIKRSNTVSYGASEEGASVAMQLGGSAKDAEDDPYAIEAEFPPLDQLGIPMVGTDADLAEDYIAGMNLMSTKVDPVTRMGYVDTVESGHVLLLTHPNSVKKVLTTSVQHFLGGLRPPSAAFFGHKVLFILEGREWLDLRNLMKKTFQKSNVKMMSEDVGYAAERLAKIANRYADSGRDVDFMRLIGAFHLCAITRVSFHNELKALEDDFDDGKPDVVSEAFEYLLEELPRRAYAPDWETQNDYESDTSDNRMLAQMAWQARDFVRKAITKRVQEMNQGTKPRGDLLQKMIEIYIEDFPSAAGDVEQLTAELGDNLVEIMFAGYNTAVPTTSHAFFFLAQNPDIMYRVMEEIDTVLEGRTCTMDDLPKLKLCENIIMETLRLCPPASLVSRQTTRDLVLEGVNIPRATRVWMPACFIHRDPLSWENPNSFDPDRWEKKPIRGSYIPFSDGARNCAGRNFAMYEATSALCAILQRYSVSVNDSYSWKTIFTGFGLRPFDFNTSRVCMRLNLHHRE